MQTFYTKKLAGCSQKRDEIIMMSFPRSTLYCPLIKRSTKTKPNDWKAVKQCLLLQITTALLLLAWDPAPHRGKMEKKLGKQG